MAINAQQALAAVKAGASARVDQPVPARFKVGDRVRLRNLNPAGHTRMPRYIRGKEGTIEHDYGVFVFPDTHAAGQGEKPQHIYVVRFSARELWGPQGRDTDAVCADVWDDYMDPA
ncbi:MAG: SH3-like domain-containing protein [Gammaproteobacteria bacterium]